MEVRNQIDDDFFDSSFNSVEFDGFLSKVDAEVKKRNVRNTDHNEFFKQKNKSSGNEVENKEKFIGQSPYNNKGQYYNMPLSLNDLNEIDFQDSFNSSKKNSSQNWINHNSVKKTEISSMMNGFKSCLSPINGKLLNGHTQSFSSTPIKKDESHDSSIIIIKEKDGISSNNKNANFTKTDYEIFDADLFEDWDKDDICADMPKENKSTITLSQALELIEESEKANESEEPNKGDLNQSIDLLTGQFVCSKVNKTNNFFDDSFNLSKFESAEKKIDNKLIEDEKKIKNCEVIILDDEPLDSNVKKIKKKPSAAQKLNFEADQDNFLYSKKIENERRRNSVDYEGLLLGKDDTFDMLSDIHFGDCENHIKGDSSSIKCLEMDSDVQPSNNDFHTKNNSSILKENNSDEFSDDSVILVKKKKKSFKLNESDSEEDSSVSKLIKKKRCTTSEDKTGRQFIESEAEVSDTADVSSDETISDNDQMEESFLDEGSYFTQNMSADMTAKYLESVKAVNNQPGTFKIPKLKPYDPVTVFSQFQPDTSTDYELDSFCVNDVPEEEEDNSELQVLEIAEKAIEMDRKKRKKKYKLSSKKTKRF